MFKKKVNKFLFSIYEKRYPVKYLMIDRSVTRLYQKIEMIRKWEDQLFDGNNKKDNELEVFLHPVSVINAKI